jgi:YbgC/YbaW family acyl-CoA thioester hydrolase
MELKWDPEQVFCCSIEARGYELDSFKHVNHAVYINYMEHARWKVFDELGITLEKLDEWKTWPVIANLEAKYIRPTYKGEVLEIRSRVAGHTQTSMFIEQKIVRGEDLVFVGKVTVVMVNEAGRPTRFSEPMAKAFGLGRRSQGESA